MTYLLRLAIRPLPTGPVTRDAVERRVALMDWSHAQTLEPDDVYGPEVVWTRANGDELHYLEDGVTGQPHWIVRAPIPELVAAEARDLFAAEDLAEVLARLATASPHEHAELASMLSVLAIDGEPSTIVHALADLLESPDPVAQKHALATIANLGWAELAPLANVAQTVPPEPAVRARATRLVEAYTHVARSLGTSVLLAGDAWRPEAVLPVFRALERRELG